MTEISQKTADLNKREEEIVRKVLEGLSSEEIEKIEVILGIQDSTKGRVDAATETAKDSAPETVEVDPLLTKFAEMYQKWSPESKARLDWKRVQTAMLANNGALLKQVQEIPKGPIMFGADKNGNILFANGGVEPILTGKTYSAARKAANAIGLELFPYKEPYGKSEEALMFEAFTGEPLVRSEDKKEWRSGWLDSGENDVNFGYARVAEFFPRIQWSVVGNGHADGEETGRGVRGLLRGKA